MSQLSLTTMQSLDLQCCAGVNSIASTYLLVVDIQMTDTNVDLKQGITVLMCVTDNMQGGPLHPKIVEIDLSGYRDPSFPPIEVSSGQPFSCCQTSW